MLVASYSGLVVSDIKIRDFGVEVVFGSFPYIFTVFFLCYFLASVFLFRGSFKAAKGSARAQIVYVLWGTALTAIFGVAINFLIPLLTGQQEYTRFGPYVSLILVAFTTYAIVAHRLFDIRVIIKRTVIFAGLSFFILGSYAAIILVGTSLLGAGGSDALSATSMIPNILAAFLIAYGFEPLRQWLTKRTDKWLFKGEYTPDEILRELAETLTNVIDLEEALNGMVKVATKSMRLTKGAVLVLQPGEEEGEYELKRAVTVGYRNSDKLQLAPKDPLIEYFLHSGVVTEHANPVVTEELLRQLDDGTVDHEQAKLTAEFAKRMQALQGAVALPLSITRQQPIPTPPGTPPRYREVETFVGVLVLGEKKSGDAFTDQDLKLLQIVATQTAAAVEKARFFEEDQLKSEFVSIASHELLTPTAAMEGYLSMILDEGMGKVDKQARDFLEKVYAESKRLASLVKDLLSVSRIERGKIVVNPVPMDLIPSIQTVVDNLQFKARELNLSLKFDAPKSLPKVQGDPEKLTEVFMNIIGNALKYTANGGVTVSTEVKNSFVVVHVKDTGIGMKPEDVKHLFTKFFRASNSDQTNQGGTGLGLYITKHIIELMGGTIAVESELNKGSHFSFSIPLAK